MPHGKTLYLKSTCTGQLKDATGNRSVQSKTGDPVVVGSAPTHGVVKSAVSGAAQSAHQSAYDKLLAYATANALTIRYVQYADSTFTMNT